MSSEATHVGFSDESHWNMGRFRSLGLATTRIEDQPALEDRIRLLLSQSDVREFKWNRCDGAKARFAAIKLCTYAVDKVCAGQLRIDVLVWDIEDSRHRISGRDDIENLKRMYYHLFRNVLRARWPNNAIWRLCPDEHTALQWETTKDCLDAVSSRFVAERSLLTSGNPRVTLRREFGIEEIRSVSSCEHPLLQLTDLFAGLAVFSRDKFDEYWRWLDCQSAQLRLFDETEELHSPSRSAEERFRVLNAFDGTCKARRLGVSLDSHRGLWTPKPTNPLNFWLYEPQHVEDRAPQKGKQ